MCIRDRAELHQRQLPGRQAGRDPPHPSRRHHGPRQRRLPGHGADDRQAARRVMGVGRYAPSITGEAHPGTLLAGLLAWLDARSRGDRLILRLEDLDTTRLRSGLSERMVADLAWFGLDWAT